jgi:hypothetical protein
MARNIFAQCLEYNRSDSLSRDAPNVPNFEFGSGLVNRPGCAPVSSLSAVLLDKAEEPAAPRLDEVITDLGEGR